jgi:hypothetical protein
LEWVGRRWRRIRVQGLERQRGKRWIRAELRVIQRI